MLCMLALVLFALQLIACGEKFLARPQGEGENHDSLQLNCWARRNDCQTVPPYYNIAMAGGVWVATPSLCMLSLTAA